MSSKPDNVMFIHGRGVTERYSQWDAGNRKAQIKAHTQNKKYNSALTKLSMLSSPNKKRIDLYDSSSAKGIYLNKPKVSTSIGNENWIPHSPY